MKKFYLIYADSDINRYAYLCNNKVNSSFTNCEEFEVNQEFESFIELADFLTEIDFNVSEIDNLSDYFYIEYQGY